MSETYVDAATGQSRSAQMDRILTELVGQVPEIEAASVVSFDGLPMASALPPAMDEDRVAAMSAALLSLGERAAEGLGRGELSQVYVEGDNGTVFLVSAEDEAVLVAVAAKAAKVGLMLFEVRRAAAALADTLRADVVGEVPVEALEVPEVPAEVPAAAPAGDAASTVFDDQDVHEYQDHDDHDDHGYFATPAPAPLQVVAQNGWPGQQDDATTEPSRWR
ncbi:MAG: roadblock/LC7 domain-containing protein [Actinomycetes bacterium]